MSWSRGIQGGTPGRGGVSGAFVTLRPITARINDAPALPPGIPENLAELRLAARNAYGRGQPAEAVGLQMADLRRFQLGVAECAAHGIG